MSRDKGNPANKGNPAKRAELEAKAQKKARRAPVNKRDVFMRVTGLVIVLVMSATLLVGIFTQF
jgi:hypothetical protein